MKNKLYTLIIILLTITSSLNIISAQEEGNITVMSSYDEEKLKSEENRTGDVVSASEDGHFNISFDDGYNGYCIDYGDDEAVEGSEFTVADTDLAVNNNNGASVGNELKTFFVDYYDIAMQDKIKTQHIIWHFTDDFTGWRVDPTLMEMIRASASEKTIPDHGAVRRINNTTEAVFDFEVLKSSNVNHQNYFAYRIIYRDILELIENETLNSNNTPSQNSTAAENSTQADNETRNTFDKPVQSNESEDENSTLIKGNYANSSNQMSTEANDDTLNKVSLNRHVTGNNYIPALIILLFGTLLIIKFSRD